MINFEMLKQRLDQDLLKQLLQEDCKAYFYNLNLPADEKPMISVMARMCNRALRIQAQRDVNTRPGGR